MAERDKKHEPPSLFRSRPGPGQQVSADAEDHPRRRRSETSREEAARPLRGGPAAGDPLQPKAD